MTLGFEFQLLPWTEGFCVYNIIKCVHNHIVYRQRQHMRIRGPYSVPTPALKGYIITQCTHKRAHSEMKLIIGKYAKILADH